MKKARLIPLLLALALLVTGCGSGSSTPSPTPPTQVSPLEEPTANPDTGDGAEGIPDGYDRSQEEDKDGEMVDGFVPEATVAQFAGATPILLDPIDMPTGTPRPPLTFTYAAYTATGLGLTFESVAGYTVDESTPNTYVLIEPAEQVKDGYPVTITFTVSPVMASYKSADARRDLLAKVAELGQINYKSWEPTYTAERTLLDRPGYYVNYRGVLLDDTIVRGRVHMALLPGNRLLMIHISYPGWYGDDYIGVFTHIRNTIKTL